MCFSVFSSEDFIILPRMSCYPLHNSSCSRMIPFTMFLVLGMWYQAWYDKRFFEPCTRRRVCSILCFKTPTTSGRTVGAGGPFFLLPVDHHSVYSYMNILIWLVFSSRNYFETKLFQFTNTYVLTYLLAYHPPAVAKKLSRFWLPKKDYKKDNR